MKPDWRPIDTAPKNGTAVLVALAGGMYTPTVAYWRSSITGSMWTIPETNRYLIVEPTHWMPLPEPPEA